MPRTELGAECRKPGASVSRLREAGANANQLSRWVREPGRPGEIGCRAAGAGPDGVEPVPIGQGRGRASGDDLRANMVSHAARAHVEQDRTGFPQNAHDPVRFSVRRCTDQRSIHSQPIARASTRPIMAGIEIAAKAITRTQADRMLCRG